MVLSKGQYGLSRIVSWFELAKDFAKQYVCQTTRAFDKKNNQFIVKRHSASDHFESLKQNEKTSIWWKIDKNFERTMWVKPYCPWYSFSKNILNKRTVYPFYENW